MSGVSFRLQLMHVCWAFDEVRAEDGQWEGETLAQ